MFKFDKTAFEVSSVADADKNRKYWLSKTPAERLSAAWFITCSAFNIDYKNPPKFDKAAFEVETRK